MVQKISNTDWLVTIPDGKTFTDALTSACKGNVNLANLLNYFLFEASREAKRLNLKKDDIECVEVKRKQADILKSLSNHNKAPSKKTLIKRIVDLQSLLYLHSDSYRLTYRVNIKAIQAALDTPPLPEKPKLRGIHARKAANGEASEQSEECKFTHSSKTTHLPEKYADLEARCVNLHSQIVELQNQIVNLHSLISSEQAARAELEAKLAARYSIDTDKDKGITDVPVIAGITPDQQVWFETIYCNSEFIKTPPSAKDTLFTKGYIKKLSRAIKTVEQLNSLFEFARRQPYTSGRPVYAGDLDRCLNDWHQTQLTLPTEPLPFPSPSQNVIIRPKGSVNRFDRPAIKTGTEAR